MKGRNFLISGLAAATIGFAALPALAQSENVNVQQTAQHQSYSDAKAPVTVRAYDPNNGQYLQGAHVVVYGVREDWKTGDFMLEGIAAEGMTDNEGDFSFKADPNQVYAFIVGKDGYKQFNLQRFTAYGFPTYGNVEWANMYEKGQK